ncbi:MAG: hypothetical protein AAF391_11275, partial [Bacteroidota bacterium]
MEKNLLTTFKENMRTRSGKNTGNKRQKISKKPTESKDKKSVSSKQNEASKNVGFQEPEAIVHDESVEEAQVDFEFDESEISDVEVEASCSEDENTFEGLPVNIDTETFVTCKRPLLTIDDFKFGPQSEAEMKSVLTDSEEYLKFMKTLKGKVGYSLDDESKKKCDFFATPGSDAKRWVFVKQISGILGMKKKSYYYYCFRSEQLMLYNYRTDVYRYLQKQPKFWSLVDKRADLASVKSALNKPKKDIRHSLVVDQLLQTRVDTKKKAKPSD